MHAVAASVAGLCAVLGAVPANAACTTVGLSTTCTSAGGTQGATVGTGGTTPAGSSVEVQAGSLVDTGNASGISLGDNASIVVRSGGTVQNFATNADSPYGGGIGANAIEFNNNSVLRIEAGGSVLANGTASDSEAVNPVGSGNTIINDGLVRSSNTAIFFQAPIGQNTVINNGRMEAGFVNGGSSGVAQVLGANGDTAVDFTNRGQVIGTLNFGNLNDALRVYTGSNITGDIDGGQGANLLTLNSDNNAADVFAPRSITRFQTLQSNGGTWTYTLPLQAAGITQTQVQGGTLILGTDNSGYAGSMRVEVPGTLQTSAQFMPQTISNDGLVRFAQADDARYVGQVSGSGGIEKTGAGTLTLPGNQAFTGTTTISGGTLQLGEGGTSGSVAGPIVDNAVLAVRRSDRLALSQAISGSGELRQLGTGTTVLSGANSYAGATTVAAGSLQAGASRSFSAASVHSVASGASIDLAGFDQQMAGLRNAGLVSLAGSTPGTTLTVTGAYVGQGGVLRISTALGNSASATDRLVLDGPGASASGNTTLAVVNRGGLGALTTGNGIEVVRAVNGATSTADAFALAGGHVDAGAYEYRLFNKDATGAGAGWYLRSTSLVPEVAPPVAPAAPVPLYRAETPLFSALPMQNRLLDLAMVGNLHQRIGDEDAKAPGQATSFSSGMSAAGGDRRAWGRVLSIDIDTRQDGTVSPRGEGRANGFQAGTDLFATPEWRAGVYVGQLEGDASVSGFARGIANLSVGRNSLRGRYLGGYATWTPGNGVYVDGVLQAGRHRSDVEAFGNPRIGADGRSLLASIEVGKSFALTPTWSIEPQLQLVHQKLELDDTAIAGALVQQRTPGSWLARAGVRLKGDMATGAGRLQPYARLNVYRASNSTDTSTYIGPAGVTALTSATGYTATEVAGGATLALSERTSVYGEVGRLWSSGGDARVSGSVQGSLGVRVRW